MKIIENPEQTTYETSQINFEGSFLQSWLWGEWQKHNGSQLQRLVVNDGSQIVAVSQFIKKNLSPLKGSYWHTIFGPTFKNSLNENEVKNIIKVLSSFFNNSAFVRFEPWHEIKALKDLTKTSLNTQTPSTSILDLTLSLDDLLTRMHPKTRYNIKIAEKHSVRIAVDQNTELAINQILETQARQRYYSAYNEGYYRELINFFKNTQPKITTYTALADNEMLASAIMVDYAKMRTYLFGGSSSNNRQKMAPYLLHWQAIQDAKSIGLSNYDFGGLATTSGSQEGFTRFKLGFGGSTVLHGNSQDYIFQPLTYRAYSILRTLNRIRLHLT